MTFTNLILIGIAVTTNWVSHVSIPGNAPLYSVEITEYSFGYQDGSSNIVRIGAFRCDRILTNSAGQPVIAPNPVLNELIP